MAASSNTCGEVASPNHRPGVTVSSVAGLSASQFHRWERHRFISKKGRYPRLPGENRDEPLPAANSTASTVYDVGGASPMG